MKREGVVACYVTGGVGVTALAAHLVHQKVWFAIRPVVSALDIYQVSVEAENHVLLPYGQPRFTPSD